jgi:hypothetical protein
MCCNAFDGTAHDHKRSAQHGQPYFVAQAIIAFWLCDATRKASESVAIGNDRGSLLQRLTNTSVSAHSCSACL